VKKYTFQVVRWTKKLRKVARCNFFFNFFIFCFSPSGISLAVILMLPDEIVSQVVALWNSGYSVSYIASVLGGRSRTTVYRLLDFHDLHGHTHRGRRKTGGGFKLSTKEVSDIIGRYLSDDSGWRLTMQDAWSDFCRLGKRICRSSFYNYLHRCGYSYKKYSPVHPNKNVAYCQEKYSELRVDSELLTV
jgi:transposase